MFTKDDINGFFGLFMNNLANLLILAALLLGVVGLPKGLVYGRIIPAIGLAIFANSSYYTYMAIKLKKKTKKDVTTLPCGISVPHMYLIVFLVIGPIYWSTKDANLAWITGVAWCFLEGIVELLGSVFGIFVKRIISRTALLASLAGVSLTYILLNPAFSIFAIPYIGLLTFVFILLSWLGKVKMPFNIPVSLFSIIVGILFGIIYQITDFHEVSNSLNNLKLNIPQFSILNIRDGIIASGGILLTAIPFGIYNFVETIDNVESAAAAGDEYNLVEAMLADGCGTIFSASLGSPFPLAVYIGHPGWKEMGAKIGYTLMSAIALLIICLTGTLEVLLNIIPIQSIEPILIYIGIIITLQSFETSEVKYYPAIIIAFIPWFADWSKNVATQVLSSVDINLGSIDTSLLSANGFNEIGIQSLSSGTIIISILWATIAVQIIDRNFKALMITSFSAFILTFVGLIHSSKLGFNVNQDMELAYASLVFVFLYCLLNERKKNEKI